jgi:voltage-gated potassium channel
VPNTVNENIHIKYGKKLRLGIPLLLGAILTGILGYMFLENYTFSEAFYMTIITISTVGYGEVKSLDSTIFS